MVSINSPRRPNARWCLGLGLTLLFSPVWALYKVVGPDGNVTYTDRPAPGSTDKVIGIRNDGSGSSTPSSPALPTALRQVAERFPVVLYVAGSDCEPCHTGRQFLVQRGIPFSERTVNSSEDVQAMVRITGTKDVPSLTIGGQVLRGMSTTEWTQYLDAAGYPATSALPVGYKRPEATPLVPLKTVVVPAAARPVPPPAQPATSPAQPAATPPAGTAGIRF